MPVPSLYPQATYRERMERFFEEDPLGGQAAMEKKMEVKITIQRWYACYRSVAESQNEDRGMVMLVGEKEREMVEVEYQTAIRSQRLRALLKDVAFPYGLSAKIKIPSLKQSAIVYAMKYSGHSISSLQAEQSNNMLAHRCPPLPQICPFILYMITGIEDYNDVMKFYKAAWILELYDLCRMLNMVLEEGSENRQLV